ncbi:Uncharacterized protein C18orf63 [Geodia barretti]|nr:Uncharacterized protein C18orf63 [Geodia barretti]
MEVSVSTLGAFLSDPRGVIRETSIYQNRCVLLPNLTVGYVFSANHQLPSSPEFPTYDSIRLHWKKQHGMILPEKQGLFFQIFFKSNSRTFFR